MFVESAAGTNRFMESVFIFRLFNWLGLVPRLCKVDRGKAIWRTLAGKSDG